MTEKEKETGEMSEEEKRKEERKRLHKSEFKSFIEWRDNVCLIDREEILNLLLFKINENLELLAESLDSLDTSLFKSDMH